QRDLLRLSADVSLTAQAFFRSRGFLLIEEREIECRGVRLKNARMEKRLRAPGYLTEDLQPREIAGPPRYRSRTDKAVECIAIADRQEVVIGYLYANDEDDAAGWQARPAAGVEAQNLAAPWIRRLRDAKQRGLRPTEALDELL